MTQATDGRAGRLQSVVRACIGPLFRGLFDLELEGLENVPTNGPAIIAANHTSVLDSFVVPAVLSRRVTYVGKAEYLDDWKTRHLFPALGMIPIDRTGGDSAQRALDVAAQVLVDGELFAIYPEGTRSRTGDLYKGRTGVARLASRVDAPVIPVGLVGMREVQPPDARFPRLFQPVRVRFGEPIRASDYGTGDEDPLRHRAMTDDLMYRIAGLTGQRYSHQYAPSAAEMAATTARPDVVVDLRLGETKTATELLGRAS